MVEITQADFDSGGTGTLQPLCVKKEWLWHAHTDPTNGNITGILLAKPEVMVKYEICIYSDRTSTINVIEEISSVEWFKRKLDGTLHGHWSLCPEIDK